MSKPHALGCPLCSAIPRAHFSLKHLSTILNQQCILPSSITFSSCYRLLAGKSCFRSSYSAYSAMQMSIHEGEQTQSHLSRTTTNAFEGMALRYVCDRTTALENRLIGPNALHLVICLRAAPRARSQTPQLAILVFGMVLEITPRHGIFRMEKGRYMMIGGTSRREHSKPTPGGLSLASPVIYRDSSSGLHVMIDLELCEALPTAPYGRSRNNRHSKTPLFNLEPATCMGAQC